MSAIARFTGLVHPRGRKLPRPSAAGWRTVSRLVGDRLRIGAPDPLQPADVLRRLARGRRWGALRRVGLLSLVSAGLAAAGLELGAGLMARTPAAPAPAAASWIEVVRPIAFYDLTGTEFARLPAVYRARRRPADEAREDVMTFGALGARAPFLQLSLLRAGAGGGDAPESLADGLARLAASRGLTAAGIRAGASVDTGFGRFSTAELLLWDRGDATPCLGFGGPADGAGVLRISGFACGAPGRPVGRGALACAIDRIDLLSAGDDDALRSVFVAAERRGGSACPASPALASANAPAATGRRFGWLDPGGDLPRLRGALLDPGTRRR